MSEVKESEKDARVAFRVSEDFKRTLDIAVAERRTTMQALCIGAIAKYLDIPIPGEEPAR